MAQSLKTYLSNRPDVQGARRALLNYTITYQTAKKEWENTPESAANYKAVLAAYNEAKAKYKELERAVNLAESNARVDYDKQESDKQVAEQKKKDAEAQKQIDSVQAEIDKYKNAGEEVPPSLQSDLEKAKSGLTGAPQGPKPTTTTTTTTTATTANVPQLEDIAAIRDNLADPKNKQLLAQVQGYLQKNAGYTGAADGKYSLAFQNALNNAFNTRGSLPAVLQGKSFLDFLASPESKNLLASAGGSGAGQAYGTISSDTQAAALIKSAFKTVLNREPTADEIDSFKKKLNTAEKKNLSKTVNGITTGGLNKDEFLTQEIQKLPEFATKKAEKLDTTKQSVLKLMRANGLPANQDQVDNFATAIQNGTTLDTVAKQIRQIAGAGLPDNIKNLLAQGIDLDTVYSPYKSTMASTLELNPNDIQLNDPTLRMALGPDKEMSIYDFQKILKKDARWQYTNNAKEEISQSVQKVLQDFGFQG